MKLVFGLWLVLPIFNGAAYIYENIVRKYVKIGLIGGRVNSTYTDNQKKVLQMVSLDARKSVERYIDRYGPEAFDRVIRSVRIKYCVIILSLKRSSV
jgi:receptor expression-enhancing protein 5/6